MQYAQILLKQKVHPWDATFTYSIPPQFLAEIKIGSLVLAPFGNKNSEGVVISLKKTVRKSIQVKLKPIKKILQPSYQISTFQLDFAKWLANTFYSNWGEALFASIPPIPRRHQFSFIKKLVDAKTYNPKPYYEILLQKDSVRYQIYCNKIFDTLKNRQSVYLIFPDRLRLKAFKQQFSKELGKIQLIEYSAKDSVTRWQNWLSLQSDTPKLILGSRLALLTPSPNLGLIILDEPSHPGFFEEQAPRYQARELTKYWHKLLKIDVIEGDILPSASQLYDLKHHQLFLSFAKIPFPSCTVKLVDMSNCRSPISPEFENRILATLQNNENVLLFSAFKGSGGTTICLDCDALFQCPHCFINLTYIEKEQYMFCPHCRYKTSPPSLCPQCHSGNLKTFGWGIANYQKWLAKNIPSNIPIITISKDQPPFQFPKSAIYLTTQAVFRYPISFSISGIINADSLLNRPDYSITEIALRTLFHLAMITYKEMIIQTEKPTFPLYRALYKKHFFPALKTILHERKTNLYPPYGSLIKIIIDNPNFAKAEAEAEKIFIQLKTLPKHLTILGPAPAYFSKIKDKYRWQIIIKSSQKIPPHIFRPIIPDTVHIEYNPPSLL